MYNFRHQSPTSSGIPKKLYPVLLQLHIFQVKITETFLVLHTQPPNLMGEGGGVGGQGRERGVKGEKGMEREKGMGKGKGWLW